MATGNNFSKIRVFIAAPYDAGKEREYLQAVLRELNEPNGSIYGEGVELEIVDWSRFIERYMRNGTINVEELPLEEGDLFIGILRFSFDGPVITGKGSAAKLGNDTKEVFECAYNAWKRTGRLQLMMYRSHRSFSSTGIDINQIKHVQNFFHQFANHYRHPPLYKVFKDTTGFGTLLQKDLINYVKNRRRYGLLTKRIKTMKQNVLPGSTARKKSGKNSLQEVVFLRVSHLLHNTILKDQPIEKVGTLVNNYHMFAEDIINRYEGVQMYADVDGSVWAFQGGEAPDRAVSAGIELISDHARFDQNKELNPFTTKLKPRLTAHSSALDISDPHGLYHTRFKNYVTLLEKYDTLSGTFAVTDILYQGLSPDLEQRLKYERNYENGALYSYSLPFEKEPLTDTEIENIKTKIEDYIEILLGNINISLANPKVAPDTADLRQYVGRIYDSYEYLYRRAAKYNEGWPEKYFNSMIKIIHSILEKEKHLSGELEYLPIKIQQKGLPNPTLLSTRDFVGSSRVYAISNLNLLLRQFKRIPGKGIDADTILEEYMREKIADFIKADDFHEETAFAELFLNVQLKKKLKTFIEIQKTDSLYGKLIPSFWRLADFVLIEDRNAPQKQKIFPVLTRDRQKGTFFKIVEKLLSVNENPESSKIKDLFAENGTNVADVKEIDIDIVKKCLLIDHPNPAVRKYVMNNIQFRQLWDIIAYPKTPLETIKEIAEHFLQWKNEERMKVFFDLTLLRLINDLFNPGLSASRTHIKTIIEIFYKFDFFSDKGYFKRLNDLTMRFKERVGGNEIGILEESMKRLEEEYKKTGGSPVSDKQPAILTELPKAVQRKLARDGKYPYFFCASTENIIADEVYRFVNHHNIGRFVSITAINGSLFHKLLRRDDLFKLPGIVAAAISNPKCDQDFAARNASKVRRAELTRISSNPNINKEIRNYIKDLLNKK